MRFDDVATAAQIAKHTSWVALLMALYPASRLFAGVGTAEDWFGLALLSAWPIGCNLIIPKALAEARKHWPQDKL